MQEQDLFVRVVVVGAGSAGAWPRSALRGADMTSWSSIVTRSGAAGFIRGQIFDVLGRPGIGHFRQPHNFLGLAGRSCATGFPDVYARCSGRRRRIDQIALPR